MCADNATTTNVSPIDDDDELITVTAIDTVPQNDITVLSECIISSGETSPTGVYVHIPNG